MSVTEIPQATPEEARRLTDRIKAGLQEVSELSALREAQRKKEPKSADRRAVYFIQATDGGPIKIGVADDPRGRLQTIQAMSPTVVRLILVLPGLGAAGERGLHRRFRAHRSHGEWYFPAPEIITFIEEHK